MRTNIELDDRLVSEALKISKLKTKKDVVNEALKSFIAALKRKQILTLREEDTWNGDLKQMRKI
ncbi:type II toxin-antitoxin system VapB family antitoxin [Olivibacter domesticus]|uniref:Transcription regulator of the Arc/MetJ class n=1 Tax=Olivibacter domesticus TaxID=407022 RepID=A0A1H7IL76_OLID1|nr:type II toxin-antitoxin system VapB family antitoxin [Olivibacter domesticus]SEK62612.1 Transcription regulator of the Arc/MetJ class [Olivibacter domesticus]